MSPLICAVQSSCTSVILKQELASITERIDEMDMREQCIREFMDKAKEYLEMPKLTPELLRVFVKKILVYEKEVKYSRTAGNPIVIHFTFQSNSD